MEIGLWGVGINPTHAGWCARRVGVLRELTLTGNGRHWDCATKPVGAMNWKLTATVTLVVLGALVGAALVIGRTRSPPTVTVTLRVAVSPREQSAFVTGQANSARFKYLVGKQAGVKPVLAQKLSIKPVPNSSLVEAQVGVQTKDQGQRYAQVFVGTLQELCGSQAQLTLAAQSIR